MRERIRSDGRNLLKLELHRISLVVVLCATRVGWFGSGDFSGVSVFNLNQTRPGGSIEKERKEKEGGRGGED